VLFSCLLSAGALWKVSGRTSLVSSSNASPAYLPARYDARVADLLKTGKLRVAIAVTPLAVTSDPSTDEMRGVAPDLARALAARMAVELQLVVYPRPGAVISGLQGEEWDVAMSLGVDPTRSKHVDFSPPFMEVDLTYLVRADVAVSSVAEADRAGIRIGVPRGDLVDIMLTRQLKRAELVRTDTVFGAFELLQAGRVDVSALPRPNLLQWSVQLAGSRVLPDRFGVNLVAIAVPKRQAGRLAYITEFIETAKASGLVQEAIQRARLPGVRLAPAADRD
jgi:polar amino acid transport system substrate-binding protein